VLKQVKSGHADYNCRKHQFQDGKIGKEELSCDYIVIGNTAFLEKKTKRNPKEKASTTCAFLFL
jgi:hypothetical protein